MYYGILKIKIGGACLNLIDPFFTEIPITG